MTALLIVLLVICTALLIMGGFTIGNNNLIAAYCYLAAVCLSNVLYAVSGKIKDNRIAAEQQALMRDLYKGEKQIRVSKQIIEEGKVAQEFYSVYFVGDSTNKTNKVEN